MGFKMLRQEMIEDVVEELARLQGHALNDRDRLEIRIRVSCALTAKERHRQRMNSPDYQWKKPELRRR